MRYYLSTFVAKKDRDYIRDRFRELSSYKRNLHLINFEQLHFNYKYIGKDISAEQIAQLKEGIEHFIHSNSLRAFSHPVNKLSVGKRFEYMPSLIKLSLKSTSEFNKFLKIVNDLAVRLSIGEVIKRKDHNLLLGVVKIGSIKRNTNVAARKEIVKKVKEFVLPEDFVVDNISLVSSQFNKGQHTYTEIFRLNFAGTEDEDQS